jgi:hypothetical protein
MSQYQFSNQIVVVNNVDDGQGGGKSYEWPIVIVC